MIYKAEIFDKFQYLFEETGFNDHQLHCVISFLEKIDTEVMKKSFGLLLKVMPILSCAYRMKDGEAYWESVDAISVEDIFTITKNEKDFLNFTTSRTNELTGPQIKACLYKATRGASISIILNHMITDAGGFKQCIYILSDLYSKLLENPNYIPDFKIDGDRSFDRIISEVSLFDKTKALLLHNKESNQKSRDQLNMSSDKEIAPFILTQLIAEDRYLSMIEYCKNRKVTVNDVILAAYDRVLAKLLKAEGRTLGIPIMVDMRRYLKDKSFQALSNLTSTVITNIKINAGETFEETVTKVNQEMNQLKSRNFGMNGFMKLAFAIKIFNEKTSYKIIKKYLTNPLICTTNIGIIDSQKLVFKGSKIENVFMCGSIKYRPHFQMALSSFQNTITLSSNLYGSREDKEAIRKLLIEVVNELPK